MDVMQDMNRMMRGTRFQRPKSDADARETARIRGLKDRGYTESEIRALLRAAGAEDR